MKYENTLLSLVETSKIFIRAQRIQDLDVITYNDVLCVCMWTGHFFVKKSGLIVSPANV